MQQPLCFHVYTFTKEVADSAIGQYNVYATPMQMALVASVVYDNSLRVPNIVKDEEEIIKPIKNILSDKNLKLIQEAMHKVVAAKHATAEKAFRGFNFKKCQVYGKTGTAQKGKKGLYDGWFVSFTKGLKENLIIATIVTNSGTGASYAAPINRKIIEAWINYNH